MALSFPQVGHGQVSAFFGPDSTAGASPPPAALDATATGFGALGRGVKH
jgi:hypothetical protein